VPIVDRVCTQTFYLSSKISKGFGYGGETNSNATADFDPNQPGFLDFSYWNGYSAQVATLGFICYIPIPPKPMLTPLFLGKAQTDSNGDFDFSDAVLKSTAEPVDANSLVNKGYVDSAISDMPMPNLSNYVTAGQLRATVDGIVFSDLSAVASNYATKTEVASTYATKDMLANIGTGLTADQKMSLNNLISFINDILLKGWNDRMSVIEGELNRLYNALYNVNRDEPVIVTANDSYGVVPSALGGIPGSIPDMDNLVNFVSGPAYNGINNVEGMNGHVFIAPL
jgi:hypothetical protein